MLKEITLILLALLMTFNKAFSQTREPYLAGTWYPGTKKELEKMLKDFFLNVKLNEANKKIIPFGLLSPHAGLVFSGQVAAYGYSLLNNKDYNTVILIGPSHHYQTGFVSIYDGDYYKTPIGNIPIDKEITSEILQQNKKFKFQEYVHIQENSLETQMPFLQYVLSKGSPPKVDPLDTSGGKDFKVVPILTVTNDLSLLNKLAEAIIKVMEESDKEILLIASSDMSHFHDYKYAVEMDQHTIDLILDRKWDKLNRDIFSGKSELCGFFAFYTFVKIAQHFGCDKGILLKYANSGDITGDTKSKSVVGYSSIVFPKEEKREETKLSPSDKEHLLVLARQSIEYYLENKKIIQPEKPKSIILNKERAVFVTLNKNHNLRGCIGQMIAQMPLYKAVAEMAASAAFNDHRFGPVKKNELKDISIEISVLTPMRRIKSIDEIEMGRDGVYVKKGMQTGVFLPQVAEETGWDKKTFLENLCAHKAFLPKDTYLDKDTEIYIFQVEKFTEGCSSAGN